MTTATQIQSKFQHQYSAQRVGWDARTGLAIIVDDETYTVANTWPWGVQFQGSDTIVSYDALWAAQAVYA